MFLVSDLAEFQLDNTDKEAAPFLSSRILLKSVVDLTVSSDLDLQEKVTHFLHVVDFCLLVVINLLVKNVRRF